MSESKTDLAIYMERLNNLLLQVSDLRSDLQRVIDDHEARMRVLEAGQIEMQAQADLDNKINRAISVGAATVAGIAGSVIK